MKDSKLQLNKSDVEWIVNEMGELGVKIKDQFFFLYKGESYKGGSKYRPVYKREFGETCYAWQTTRITGSPYKNAYTIAPMADNYIGHLGESIEEWKDIPEEKSDEG